MSEDVFYVSGYVKLSRLPLPCGQVYFTPFSELVSKMLAELFGSGFESNNAF